MSIHFRTVNGEQVKVITSNNCPPIPDRSYDWSAVDDNYEEGCPIGHGATEEAAIADLIEQLEDRA